MFLIENLDFADGKYSSWKIIIKLTSSAISTVSESVLEKLHENHPSFRVMTRWKITLIERIISQMRTKR